MAEFTAVAQQTVAPNQNVILTENVICSRCITHREGAGIVCLRHSGNPCNPARYKVCVKANIAIPTEGGTVDPISLALSLGGDILTSSIATVTPTVTGAFFNVFIVEEVCANVCPSNVAIVNPNTQDILVSNATMVVDRIN